MLLLVFSMYVLFASTFTLAKAVLSYIPPILFIGIRMTIAGILMLLYYKSYSAYPISIRRRDWGLFGQGILFIIFCAYVLEFWALQFIDSGKSSLFFNLSPFITALFSYVIWREKLTKNQLVGMLIGFLGFIPLVYCIPTVNDVTGHCVAFVGLPELILLISVASFAYGWIVMKELVVVRSYSPLLVNGISMLGGGILAFITSLLLEGRPHLITVGTQTTLQSAVKVAGYMGALILISNVICYNLYGYLLREYTATFLSFAGFTTPFFAVLFGVIFLGETVTWSICITAALVALGLYIFYKDEFKRQKNVES